METGMKKADLSEIWEELRISSPIASQGFRMRQYGSSGHTRCYAAISCPDGCPAFIIEIDAGEPRIRFSAFSTKAFSVDYGTMEGIPPGSAALILTLHDTALTDLFAILCIDLDGAIEHSPVAAAASREAEAVLERWRAFLRRHSALMTREEVRGLIGELVTLARLIMLIGEEAAVMAWRGPLGGIRDFDGELVHAETKTFTPSSGASVFISDPLQLEAPTGCRLSLVCIAVDQSPSGASLLQYVLAVETMLQRHASALELFRQRVAAAGFLPSMAEALPETFVAFEPRVFEVRDGFPRILPGSIPPGVKNVRFAIELSALGAFAIETDSAIGARSPTIHVELLP
jgi:hypothetical protein